jgi:hypothetical protein
MKPLVELCLLVFNPFILETDFPFLNYKSKLSFYYSSYTGSNAPISEIGFNDIIEEGFNSDNAEIPPLDSDKRIESTLEYFYTKAKLLYRKNTIEVSSDSVTLLWLFAVF